MKFVKLILILEKALSAVGEAEFSGSKTFIETANITLKNGSNNFLYSFLYKRYSPYGTENTIINIASLIAANVESPKSQ